MNHYSITKSEWDKNLEEQLPSYKIYGTVDHEFGIDYEIITASKITLISYNKPKPFTPLKSFFLPVKENVSGISAPEKPVLIIGSPNCDVSGLKLLDEIYLDFEYPDIFYKNKRDNTTIISSDCTSILEHCHCISSGINPFSVDYSDVSLLLEDDQLFLTVFSNKGEKFIQKLNSKGSLKLLDKVSVMHINKKHNETISNLKKINKLLPDYKQTGNLIENSGDEIWKKYSINCVSCGACSTVCPTCSCFLLIDRPDFEKIRQMDVCQFPGFERVAGGEDALHKKNIRFRNRYKCKYVWKPEKFKSVACTGCGRCIETCIGKINKNELLMELVNK